jgi:hypothetical protein
LETNQLFPFVLTLILVGLLIGVGTLILDKTRISGSDTITFNESISLVNATSVTVTSTYVTLVEYIETNDTAGIQAITTANFTTTCPTTTDSSPEQYCKITLTETGADQYLDSTFGIAPRVTGTKKDISEAAPTVLATATGVVGSIASDWLSLIVTIAVLAIILTLVIQSFATRR